MINLQIKRKVDMCPKHIWMDGVLGGCKLPVTRQIKGSSVRHMCKYLLHGWIMPGLNAV